MECEIDNNVYQENNYYILMNYMTSSVALNYVLYWRAVYLHH